MSAESKLMDAAKKATGDDSIIDVAEFRPRGSAVGATLGVAAGSALGGAGDSGWGRALGAGVGYSAGRSIQADRAELPKYMALAISPDAVYVLGIPVGFWSKQTQDAYPMAVIDRDRLGVEVHQRINVRVVVLEDMDTGGRFELEAERLNRYHAKALIELLQMSDEHHDTEEPTED